MEAKLDFGKDGDRGRGKDKDKGKFGKDKEKDKGKAGKDFAKGKNLSEGAAQNGGKAAASQGPGSSAQGSVESCDGESIPLAQLRAGRTESKQQKPTSLCGEHHTKAMAVAKALRHREETATPLTEAQNSISALKDNFAKSRFQTVALKQSAGHEPGIGKTDKDKDKDKSKGWTKGTDFGKDGVWA